MSRENIDDKDLADPRYLGLVTRLNCPFVALGAWAGVRMLAGRLWREDMGLIPRHLWEGGGFPAALFEVGLAWRTDANGNRTDVDDRSAPFIYVDGTRERNAWYFEKKSQASEAGKKSAEARRAKGGNARPSGGKTPNEARTDVNGRSTGVEPPSTEGNEKQPSFSVSVSVSEKQGNIHAGARGPQGVQPDPVDQDRRNREVAQCESVWLATIQDLGVERNFVRPEEQSVIFQLIDKFGAKETALALEGARYETASKGYDPRQHVKIARAWNRFTAWADMARNPSLRGQSEQPTGASIADILERQQKAGAV